MAKRPRCDLLSNLPVSIIHSILALVPIRDAVKTKNKHPVKSVEYLSKGVESYRCSLVFHRLTAIELCSVSFSDIKELWVVVRLIMGAPNLHKLKIKTALVEQYPSEVAGISFWGSECAPNCTFERLKKIEMMGTGGGRLEMNMIKFLLESSPMLETLILKPLRFDDHKLLIMAAELLRCRRASANAEIILDGLQIDLPISAF